jgi:thiamine phosphate synthase YjbQ (UPF0047 family)
MKSFRKEPAFDIPSRMALVDLTPQVEAALRESGVREGAAATRCLRREVVVAVTEGGLDFGLGSRSSTAISTAVAASRAVKIIGQ